MDINSIQELLSPKLESLGYNLYEIKTRKEMGNLVLSIVVDRKEVISMEDIVNLSNELNEFFDEIDPIEEEYMLDISSLGIEKPLKIEQLNEYVNSYVHLHLINPRDGENIYEGTIEKVEDDILTLSYFQKTRKKLVQTELSNIYKIRLAIKF